MYRCPSCHEKGITYWEKFQGSAWRKPACRVCGQKVETSGLVGWCLASFAFTPFLIAVPALTFWGTAHVLLPLTGANASYVLALIATLLLLGLLHGLFALFMPIRKSR